MTTSTKKLIIIFFLNLIITTLHSDTINQLSNKNLTISGYFFSSDKSLYFLSNIGENNSSLWLYTKQRKFKPIHNARAYDGYDKADILFKSIAIDDNHSINISGVINNDSPHKDISNQTFIPTHLLLKDKDTASYNVLANKNATSLWEYTNRKFKPIHNAGAYDGYEEAKKIFDNINMTKDNIIHIGDINTLNYASFKTKEYSLNNTRAIKIIKSSDYKDNFIQLTDNLIKDKTNELIWQNNNVDNLRNYQEAKAYCENLEIDGYSGFRLPNGLEAFSLFNEKIKSSHLERFNIKPNFLYWTSHWMSDYPSIGSKTYNAHKFKIITHEENNTLRFNFNSYWIGMIPRANTICVKGKDIVKPTLLRDNKKEVVKDLNNALMWQDNIPLRHEIKISKLDNYCSSSSLGGFNDWRYPDFKEFFTISYSKKRISKIPIFNNFTIGYQTNLDDRFSNETQKDIITSTDSIWKDMIYGDIVDKKNKNKVLSYYSNKTKDEILLKNSLEVEQLRKEKVDSIQKEINNLEDLKPITKENYKQILMQKRVDEDPNKDTIDDIMNKNVIGQLDIIITYYILDNIIKKAEMEGYDVAGIRSPSSVLEEITSLKNEIISVNDKENDTFKEDVLIDILILGRSYQSNFIIQDEDKKYFFYRYVDNKRFIDATTSKSPFFLISAICVRKL